MREDVRAKWVAALRSGEYTQTRCAHGRAISDRTEHCAVGVLLDLAVKEGVIDPPTVAPDGELVYKNMMGEFSSTEVFRWSGLRPVEEAAVVLLNDDRRATFGEIADYIETEI